MDWDKERLVRYGFQLIDCNGQPFLMQAFWVPERLDGTANWAGIFQGRPPVLHQTDHLSVPLRAGDDYSARLTVIRE